MKRSLGMVLIMLLILSTGPWALAYVDEDEVPLPDEPGTRRSKPPAAPAPERVKPGLPGPEEMILEGEKMMREGEAMVLRGEELLRRGHALKMRGEKRQADREWMLEQTGKPKAPGPGGE